MSDNPNGLYRLLSTSVPKQIPGLKVTASLARILQQQHQHQLQTLVDKRNNCRQLPTSQLVGDTENLPSARGIEAFTSEVMAKLRYYLATNLTPLVGCVLTLSSCWLSTLNNSSGSSGSGYSKFNGVV